MEQATQATVVGVRFSKVGKIYDFETNGLTDLKVGDMVVVETSRGWQLGSVAKVVENAELPAEGWKSIDRRATPRDLLLRQMWQQREAEVVSSAKAKSVELKLQGIKIIGAEYSFDGSRLTVLFSSETEEKYELKSLRQDMQKMYAPSQVEMRQIGPRDVAKHTCGMGACGLEKRCCCSFLTEFSSISIRMAKEQGISLTPTEITGMCGRLRCCLIYEYETYVDARATLPKRNKRVRTPQGEGKVIDVAPLRGAVIVDIPEQGYREFPLSEITVIDESGQPVTAPTAGRPAMSEPEKVEVEHSGPEDGFLDIFQPRPAMDEPHMQPKEGRPERGERPERPERGGRGQREGREGRPGGASGGIVSRVDRGPQAGRGSTPTGRGELGRGSQEQPERGGQPRGTQEPRGGRQERGGKGSGGQGRGRETDAPGDPNTQRDPNAQGRGEGSQRQRGQGEGGRGQRTPPDAGRGRQRPGNQRRRQPGEGGGPAGGGQAPGGGQPSGEEPANNQGGRMNQGRPNRESRQQHGPRGGRDQQRRKGQNHDSNGDNTTNNTGGESLGEN